MYRVGNKIVKIGNKICVSENQSILEFTVRGTSFPDTQISSWVQFNSTAGNKMYANFNDGTGVHVYLPNNLGLNFNWVNTVIHYYQDLLDTAKINTIDKNYSQERKIQIWFDFPQRVFSILIQNTDLYGEFPKNIGNYNLSAFKFNAVRKLTSFPARFRGGVFDILNLNNISPTKLTFFPNWIGNSKITSLTLNTVFNLSSGSTVTNIDSISNCVGLTNLFLGNNDLINNDAFPSTLKDISTLRDLRIGNNAFVTFPTRVGECSQLTKLVLSDSDSNGYADYMTDWGDGIGLMTSLISLIYAGVTFNIGSLLLTTDLPLRLENCINLKIVEFSVTFRTQVRIDTHVNNWYNFIVSNASTTTGNTKFRNMTFDISKTISINSLRPSGGATPTSTTPTPTTPMQMIYNLCKIYGHTWKIRNAANTGIETITPTS